MGEKTVNKLRMGIDVALIFVCCFMIFDGVSLFMSTMGVVQSTEFQMFICLVHMLAVMMIWMSVLTFRQIIIGIITRKS